MRGSFKLSYWWRSYAADGEVDLCCSAWAGTAGLVLYHYNTMCSKILLARHGWLTVTLFIIRVVKVNPSRQ